MKQINNVVTYRDSAKSSLTLTKYMPHYLGYMEFERERLESNRDPKIHKTSDAITTQKSSENARKQDPITISIQHY